MKESTPIGNMEIDLDLVKQVAEPMQFVANEVKECVLEEVQDVLLSSPEGSKVLITISVVQPE